MSHAGIWICDGCGAEDRGGMAGFPPETWVRVKATVKHHTESPTHDFCPVCGADVNAFDIGLSGTPIVQPKARSKKKSEDLDEVDHGE